MFDKEKYITKNIQNQLPQETILFLWTLIEKARSQIELDLFANIPFKQNDIGRRTSAKGNSFAGKSEIQK